MSNARPFDKMFRLSLRELFLLVALVALAIVSLRYAGDKWQTAIAMLTLIVFIGAVIAAVIDRGPRQAFALGMILAMVIYGTLIVFGESGSGIGPLNGSGNLPTTRLLTYLLAGVQENRWFDRETNEEIPNFDPIRNSFARPPVQLRIPNSHYFIPIGHAWWALLWGYFGGRFARFLYARRLSENRPLAAESS